MATTPRSKFKTLKEVEEKMLLKLDDSGLDSKDAKRLGLRPMLAGNAPEVPVRKAGFLIPYFDLNGKKTSFWRYRYLETVKDGFAAISNRKDMRYAQAPKTVNEIYFPPLLDWKKIAMDPNEPLCVTEGELKASCAAKAGIPTMGLGGVWCFKSSHSRLPLLPQFKEINWQGRTVYIVYDSDATSNAMVLKAENALADELLKLGAIPMIARLPALAPPAKTGLDDFLVSEGEEAFREILESASQYELSRELHRLNEEVVYVEDPGIILRLDTLQRLSVEAFVRHAYSQRIIMEYVELKGGGVKAIEKSAPVEWLKWAQRASVPRITYAPGQDRLTAKGELNIWKGWAVAPAEGSIQPFKKLLDYLFRDEEPEIRRWFECWLAYPLKFPGSKLLTSVVLWGLVHGTGKSLVGYTMFKIYGSNSTEISNQDLQSSHNEWAENRQFVMGDEITGGDKRHSADRMKSMITQKQLRINVKFIPTFTVPDCINYYFTSNHPDAFFLEDTDRRFFIHEVKGSPMDEEFYAEYMEWLEGTGAHALFYYLLNLDLGDFNPQGHAPITQSKRDMIDDGRSDLSCWVDRIRTAPDMILRMGDEIMRYELWTTSELLSLYDPTGTRRITANGIGRELRRAGFQRVYRGMPIPTKDGPQKLWALRNTEALHRLNNGARLGEIYDNERGGKPRDPSRKKKF